MCSSFVQLAEECVSDVIEVWPRNRIISRFLFRFSERLLPLLMKTDLIDEHLGLIFLNEGNRTEELFSDFNCFKFLCPFSKKILQDLETVVKELEKDNDKKEKEKSNKDSKKQEKEKSKIQAGESDEPRASA